MQTYEGIVRDRRNLSPHLLSITLGGLSGWTSAGIPDEYVRLNFSYRGQNASRVYSVFDHRTIGGDQHVEIVVAVHDGGIGSDWARECRPGEPISISAPHGFYAAPSAVPWQLLVCDLTGLPAASRILRELRPHQHADVHVVLMDPSDVMSLHSPADIAVSWQVVETPQDIPDAMAAAVVEAPLLNDANVADQYVWVAGEARASRLARRWLRRELYWPQSSFYTCGYWQVDAHRKAVRYEQVAAEVARKSREARAVAGEDEAAYADALDDIYESMGL